MRKAKALSDGRVEREVTVRGYRWRCVCRPEDGHDHEGTMRELDEKMAHRDAIVGGLNALVGTKGRVGLLRYEITDCNIQIHGSRKWLQYLAWDEVPVMGGDVARREMKWYSDSPALAATPQEVVESIEKEVGRRGGLLAEAIRSAGDFNAA